MIIKLENVVLDALVDESPSRTADVTDKPVEKGQDVSDHMKQNPTIIRLSGSVVNDAANKLAILNDYQEEAKLLKFHGRNIFADVVLLQLNTKHNAPNGKGFDYEIALKQVRIANVETFEVTVKNPETGEQDAETSSKVQQQKNKGRQKTSSTNPQSAKDKNTPISKSEGVSAETKAFVEKLGNQSLADSLSEYVKNNSKTGGGGTFGGSSTNTSSSGRDHGGGGGEFTAKPVRPPQTVTFKGKTYELY